MKIKKKIKNAVGTAIAKYIIRSNTEGWLVTRKTGTQQIIKVFSRQAYENMIRPVIYNDAKQVRAGDIVTAGYHGEVVVTEIHNGYFQGYYRADGVTVKGLEIEKFKKTGKHVDIRQVE